MYLFLFDEQRLNDSFIYVYSTCIVNDWLKNNCVLWNMPEKSLRLICIVTLASSRVLFYKGSLSSYCLQSVQNTVLEYIAYYLIFSCFSLNLVNPGDQTMGRIFLDHIGGTRLFSCANCDTILTNRSELISTRFTGATGRAFLFNKVQWN